MAYCTSLNTLYYTLVYNTDMVPLSFVYNTDNSVVVVVVIVGGHSHAHDGLRHASV